MSEVLLTARNLTKRFGGLAAVNDVSVDLWRDRIHAVIGPNGAGKSTLANLLSGDIVPTSGAVHLAGREIRFAAGETIHTESSHKYRPDRLRALAAAAGWHDAAMWSDPRKLFSVWLLELA